MRNLTFIIPCFNAAPNLESLYASLVNQDDEAWNAIFIDDKSTDNTADVIKSIESRDGRVTAIINDEKKFALKNIVEMVRSRPQIDIVAVVDGDDELCSNRTVSLIKEAHIELGMVVWTAHRWDVNGLNISKDMPQKINPYQHPWCSSHLRTFDARLIDNISDDNFKDHMGRWFERGYDQALMLPLLATASSRKYIPEVCYLYKIDSVSVNDRDWAERKQLSTVNMVRSRGLIR